MIKYLLILITGLISSGCFAVSSTNSEDSCPNRSLDDLYASYVIYDVVRYRGGLTSEASAEARVGKNILVGQAAFKVRDITISDPLYEITCYPTTKEGNVDANRWSNFYGHGLDREHIKVLHIYTNGEKGEEPFINLEVVDDELWEMHDGWLYMMKPVSERE
ncbi:hypothetical protein [uncultured Marinobacter sp.]|uniref:hypothetical protein n=1 Tax=uncultured Marinobacter sp. TaxID=187379 RepID=UPI002601E0D6|nr:hypothetical protein [uncultured Marinobacter sp.]